MIMAICLGRHLALFPLSAQKSTDSFLKCQRDDNIHILSHTPVYFSRLLFIPFHPLFVTFYTFNLLRDKSTSQATHPDLHALAF